MGTWKTNGRVLILALFAATVLLLRGSIFAAGQDGGDPKPPVKLGKMAPNFTVTGLDGKKRSLADNRGKVVLVNFWATWCPPSCQGLPEIQSLAKTYGDKGLAVLTVSDEETKTISSFLKSKHYTFPTYRDSGKVMAAYNVGIIPTVAVFDKDGRLTAYMVGLQEPKTIKAALKKAGMTLN